MKNLTLDDFSGGMNNAMHPELIPDNMLADALNYVYDDAGVLRSRPADKLYSKLALQAEQVSAFAIWYPSPKPKNLNETEDTIYLILKDGVLGVWYKTTHASSLEQIRELARGISNVSFFVSSNRVIVSSPELPCSELFVDKNAELIFSEIGIGAPLSLLSISKNRQDNVFAVASQDEIGMGIERGTILQYCYTLENRFGVESPPSPIYSESRLTHRYRDYDNPLGFSYYWFSTLINRVSLQGVDEKDRANLKYINIYRREIDALSGTIGKQFNMIHSVPIRDGDVPGAQIDAFAVGDKYLERNLTKAPLANTVTAVGGIVFAGGAVDRDFNLPFKWDGVMEIDVTNNNDIDYAEAVVSFPLALTKDGKWDIRDDVKYAIENNLARGLRVFFKDKVTPCKAAYKYNDSANVLYLIVRVPYLDRGSITSLYFAYSKEHGVPKEWDDEEYGRFVSPYDENQVLAPLRVISNSHIVSCQDAMDTADYPYGVPTGMLPNLANQNAKGEMETGKNYQSKITHGIIPRRVVVDKKSYSTIGKAIEVSANPGKQMMCTFETHSFGGELLQMGLEIDVINTVKQVSREELNGNVAHYNTKELVRTRFNPESDDISISYRVAMVIGGTPSKHYLVFYHHTLHGITLDSQRAYGKVEICLEDAVGYSSLSFNNLFDIHLSLQGVSKAITISWKHNKQSYTKILYSNPSAEVAEWKTMIYGHGSDGNVRNLILRTDPSYKYNLYYLSSLAAQGENTESELMALHKAMISNSTFYRIPIGFSPADDFASWNTDDIPSISIKKQEKSPSFAINEVRWTNLLGNSFEVNNTVRLTEPALALLPSPSFLPLEYRNTVLCFTRNTVSRLVFSDDMKSMADSANSIIQENFSLGLYAPKTLKNVSHGCMWLSEAGVILWTEEGILRVSQGVIDTDHVGRPDDFAAVYYPDKGLYLLSDKGKKVVYVFNVWRKAWTRFDESMAFGCADNLDQGRAFSNTILMLVENEFREFPAEGNTDNSLVLKTKKYRLDNLKPVRFRLLWHSNDKPTNLRITTENNIGNIGITHNYPFPERFRWEMFPIGFWGENLQFEFWEMDALNRIEINLKDGV